MSENIQDCQGSQSPGQRGTKFDPKEILSNRTVVLEQSGTPENISQHRLKLGSDSVQRISENNIEANFQTVMNNEYSLPQEKFKGI